MNQNQMSRREFLKHSFIGLVSVIPLTAGYSYGIEPRWLEVVERKIKLHRLPDAFHGIKIVVFGDLHARFHMDENEVEQVVELIIMQKPDLLLFTGDLVDQNQEVLASLVPHLQNLHAPLGKFAVLGNHDYHGELVSPSLRKAGFHVLHNQHKVIQRGMDMITIAGVEDLLVGEPNLEQALHDTPDTCTILLLIVQISLIKLYQIK